MPGIDIPEMAVKAEYSAESVESISGVQAAHDAYSLLLDNKNPSVLRPGDSGDASLQLGTEVTRRVAVIDDGNNIAAGEVANELDRSAETAPAYLKPALRAIAEQMRSVLPPTSNHPKNAIPGYFTTDGPHANGKKPHRQKPKKKSRQQT